MQESGDVRGGSGRGDHHDSAGPRSVRPARAGSGFTLQIALWLWFTVLFANFAEAMAEARGKAQADALRKTKTDTIAKRHIENGQMEAVPGFAARAPAMSFSARPATSFPETAK